MKFFTSPSPEKAPKANLIRSAKDLAIWLGYKGLDQEEAVDLVVQAYASTSLKMSKEAHSKVYETTSKSFTKHERMKTEMDKLKQDLPESKPVLGHPFLYLGATFGALMLQVQTASLFQPASESAENLMVMLALGCVIAGSSSIGAVISSFLPNRLSTSKAFMDGAGLGLLVLAPIILILSGLYEYYQSSNYLQVLIVVGIQLLAISIHFILSKMKNWFNGEVNSPLVWFAFLGETIGWTWTTWRLQWLKQRIHSTEEFHQDQKYRLGRSEKLQEEELDRFKAEVRLNYRLGVQLALQINPKVDSQLTTETSEQSPAASTTHETLHTILSNHEEVHHV